MGRYIHSENEIEGLKSKLSETFDLKPHETEKMERNRKKLEHRIRENIPLPPPVELSPNGDLITTYTPELNIVNTGMQIPVVDKPNMTTSKYIMEPVVTYGKNHKYRLLPLSFLTKKEVSQKMIEHSTMILNIDTFPTTYEYLSPRIFSALKGVKRLGLYGNVLVLGKLRDELIPNILLTSIEVIESRFFTSRDETIKIMKDFGFMYEQMNAIGPTPANPDGHDIPNINQISPNSFLSTSLQRIGYSNHPMFRKQPMSRDEEMQLVKLSEKQKKLRGEDFAFIFAHGRIENELSPEMKLLANKYLRVIELGKAGQLFSPKYMSIVIEVNNILRNPSYQAMFDNTDEGEMMRKSAFRLLCPYIRSGRIDLCKLGDTFDLIDITHDRHFNGHVVDSEINENQKITYKTLHNRISMGIFLPVDYNTDNTTPYKAKKELFKLYPDTTFLSSTTNMKLVETLLPIAIKKNRRINLLIHSCGGITQDDSLYEKPAHAKPGTTNPAIELLTVSKKYLSILNNIIEQYVKVFSPFVIRSFKQGVNVDNLDLLYEIAHHMNDVYINFQMVVMHCSSDKVDSNFSFAGLDTGSVDDTISNDLIGSRNPYKYFKMGTGSYIDEIIKVKIFLMHEFKTILSFRIIAVKKSLDIIVKSLTEYRALFGPGPFPSDLLMQNTCDTLDKAIQCSTIMNEYFRRLEVLVNYINNGLTPRTNPNSFLSYKKYREIKKEYDEGAAKEFYESLVENLDYDRFEGENVGFNERLYKTSLLNPLTAGPFRRTKRYMYKYSTLPNYDQVKDRRKTMKKQLYDKMKIGEHAQKATKSANVSV